jgi:hypothetical protein
LHGYPVAGETNNHVTIKIGNKVLFSDNLTSYEVKQVPITLTEPFRKHSFRVVQNAGNIVLHSGYSKDRGSILRFEHHKPLEFYDRDSAYFRRSHELIAMCGASCLIKREVIDHVGFLDGHYFMNRLGYPCVFGQGHQVLLHARKGYDELQNFFKQQISGLNLARQFLRVKE